ncbi:MAG: Dabb family protein [Gammaproteobacteria bacterium]
MRILCGILLCLVITACASTQSNELSKNNVVHVVLIWLNQPDNKEHIQQVIDATNHLKVIQEVQSINVGQSIPSNRKIVDDSFDVGLTMTFESVEDMERYFVHPSHKKVVETILKPLVSKITVYDFNSK